MRGSERADDRIEGAKACLECGHEKRQHAPSCRMCPKTGHQYQCRAFVSPDMQGDAVPQHLG
jgi:hypothetical protein